MTVLWGCEVDASFADAVVEVKLGDDVVPVSLEKIAHNVGEPTIVFVVEGSYTCVGSLRWPALARLPRVAVLRRAPLFWPHLPR